MYRWRGRALFTLQLFHELGELILRRHGGQLIVGRVRRVGRCVLLRWMGRVVRRRRLSQHEELGRCGRPRGGRRGGRPLYGPGEVASRHARHAAHRTAVRAAHAQHARAARLRLRLWLLLEPSTMPRLHAAHVHSAHVAHLLNIKHKQHVNNSRFYK